VQKGGASLYIASQLMRSIAHASSAPNMALVDAMSLTWLLLMLLVMVVLELLSSRGSLACPAAGGSPGAVAAVICDVLEAEASDQAGLASWVANIRAAADEMATRIADMLMHMGGD
jgi:hypothetical protein